MAKRWWFQRLLPKRRQTSYIRDIVTGSFYRISDIRGNTSVSDIKTQIDTMRALAADSQISTALSYYATDATTPNTSGQIIWASSTDDKYKDVAEIINNLIKRWNVNEYARDHILELATIGNLYIPTTGMYKTSTFRSSYQKGVALDNNTILDEEFDVIPSTKVPPENIIHLWKQGQPQGYIYQPDENVSGTARTELVFYPESAVIHFSLGGLLGDYTFDVIDDNGDTEQYDIQFSTPLMAAAVQPTQTLSLLEDALLLSSLARTIKFINVACGSDEDEIRDSLQQIKDAVEQQLSLNTLTGDVQSFVNPQSPNNLIYLPRIDGQDAITVTDLNMAEASEQDSNLLNHYQDKKLSVLGVPKEALNFSSNEGLGGAGSVMSQRSALYANALMRLETAYMAGWRTAFNTYFKEKKLSGFVDKFQLHMQPIITQQSTINFDRRDSALNQASTFVQILKDLGIKNDKTYKLGLVEILTEVLPQIGSDASTWNPEVDESESGGGGGANEF